MKVAQLFFITLLIISFATSTYAQQEGMGLEKKQFKEHYGRLNIPDLTDEQKEKIKSLRTANIKEMTNKRNTIEELKAKLKTLQTADKPNMNEINSKIDEISIIKTKMAKKRTAIQQNVRSLLTDEQRVIFDSRPMGERGEKGRGSGRNEKRHRNGKREHRKIR